MLNFSGKKTFLTHVF